MTGVFETSLTASPALSSAGPAGVLQKARGNMGSVTYRHRVSTGGRGLGSGAAGACAVSAAPESCISDCRT